MSETRSVRPKIRTWLKAQGAYVTTIHGGPFGKRGEADLIACWQGRYWWIECKAAKGRASKAQLARLAAVRAAGGSALIAREIEDLNECARRFQLCVNSGGRGDHTKNT